MHKRTQRNFFRARLKEFVLPPIVDGLVLGRNSPVGPVAMGKALDLLSTTAFSHVAIEDDVISDILVRTAILRKISAEQVKKFVVDEVKPLMGDDEIIHLTLDVEINLEADGR